MSVWKHLAESVMGTSHERTNTPCQDNNRVTNYSVEGVDYLIVVCSDGAGSASHSDMGSRLACEVAVHEICRFFDTKATLLEVDRTVALAWLNAVRSRLASEAELHGIEVRQLASTLLIAVAGNDRSVFIQIGDGAIVTFDSQIEDGNMRLVFWPQNGEYANTTNFVTDARADELVMIEASEHCPEGIAAFTDGVQLLALDYVSRRPYSPFFEPFFRQLREAVEPDDLIVPFRQFLNSKQVNDRTDDDKTLIIAVRNTARVE